MNDRDAAIGRRLRERRSRLGLSQVDLAARCGLPLRKIQQYERGVARISASQLAELSAILEVGIAYFFDDGPC
jgi:transcriptional regulator with XRE-family HTH domain